MIKIAVMLIIITIYYLLTIYKNQVKYPNPYTYLESVNGSILQICEQVLREVISKVTQPVSTQTKIQPQVYRTPVPVPLFLHLTVSLILYSILYRYYNNTQSVCEARRDAQLNNSNTNKCQSIYAHLPSQFTLGIQQMLK